MRYKHLISMSLGITVMLLIAACPGPDIDQQVSEITKSDDTSNKPSSSVLPSSGKVVKAMHAGGYTYMQVDSQGKQFWVAATMLNVKRNDHISWTGASMMKDFKSASLRRTFDEILFVTKADIEK